MKFGVLAAGIAIAAVLAVGPARAQDFATAASDASAERSAKLLAAAKAEGEVVVYSTAPPDDNKALTSAFEAKYGIPVKLWRASSEEILQRAVAEARAGRPQADALINTGIGLEAMYREKLLAPVVSPFASTLIPEAVPDHHTWVGFYLAVMVQFANTNIVKKADLPKSWEDLAAPKWKDKLAIEASDFDWFQATVETMGRDSGLALFRDIVAKNKISVRKGHSLVANLVVAGEVPVALTVYDFTAAQLRASGAPVEPFVIAPAMGMQVAVALPREPKHPNAALLLHDFLTSDAQEVLAKRNFVTSRKDNFAKAPYSIKVPDAARTLDGAAEWEELYRKTFLVK